MSNLDDLEKKLHDAEHKHQLTPEQIQAAKDAENKRVGLQAGFELTASVALGVIVGLGLDRWFESKPAFLIICFILGVCVGFYNIYRVTNNLGSSVGFSQLHRQEKDAKTSPSEENDLDKTDNE